MRPSAARRSYRALGTALVLGLLLGCSEEPTQPGDAEVASVRLIENGVDVTDHVALNSQHTARITVRLFAADGRQITGLDDRFEVAFAFDPEGLATAAAVSGEPLAKDVTATAPPETIGSLQVSVSRPERGTSRSFGPFQVVIH